MAQLLISVVTPFHNTAPYLAECIESVLAQSYSNFEFILSDNCSTDGSGDIAEAYAKRDPRIRLIRQPRLLSQGDHYNNVLTYLSDSSRYCKIVQADDYIFPDCLRCMVQAFEQSESIGLVSSYYLKGRAVMGSGYPYPAPILPGKEMARLFLRTGVFVFGSESTVMYRSSLIRDCQPFFNSSLLHADTEKCMQILNDWDFGFVHQVLSFLRVDNVNESISAAARALQPAALDWHINVQRYADSVLEKDESSALKSEARREYYDVLAREALHLRGSNFWQYHRKGLKTLGETLDFPFLVSRIVSRLLGMVVNPGDTIASVIQSFKSKPKNTSSGRDSLPRQADNIVARNEQQHGEAIPEYSRSGGRATK